MSSGFPDPIMWGYIIGGATIFGAIVAISAFLNGRATRKVLIQEKRATRELISRTADRITGMIKEMREEVK